MFTFMSSITVQQDIGIGEFVNQRLLHILAAVGVKVALSVMLTEKHSEEMPVQGHIPMLL